jgi:DNA (cytosine-5)-methyltransferase 1
MKKQKKYVKNTSNQGGKIKVCSLFSGIGGFELGIINAIGERADFVAYSEINKYAIQIYEKQFTKRLPYCSNCWEQKERERELPTKRESIGREDSEVCINCSKSASLLFNKTQKNYGNITTIIPNELPDFELLVGGFPCQSFSIAGKRGGFNDTRGTLFFDIARICADKKPRNLLLENVKGLLSHDGGKTFQTIIGVLTDLGYFVEWQVLNSKNFGVPQNRERVFIIGHLGGEPRRKVFPIGEDTEEIIKPVKRKRITTGRTRNFGSSAQLHQSDEICSTITTSMGTGGNNVPCILPKDMKIRRLTPTECERLQGFPDNFTKYGINEKGEQIEISDTQRYKTLGNAVTVNVIKEIIKRIA